MKHDLVVVIGTTLSLDEKDFLKEIEDSKIALVSVMEDLSIMDRVGFFSRYEAGSEEGVVAILAKELLSDKKIDSEIENYFDELDEGYLSAETNIGEEELEDLHVKLQNAKSPLIVFGKDMFLNERAKNISKFINLIAKYSGYEVRCLENLVQDEEILPEEIKELESFDGTIVFEYKNDDSFDSLYGSAQFAVAAKLQDGQNIEVKKQKRKFILDKKLKGTIALMPSMSENNSYRYQAAKIIKREV